MGNLFGVLGLLVSLPLIWRFNSAATAPQFQFLENADWIPSIGAHYTLGIDGISFLLVMLTTVLGAISILSSWSAIKTRRRNITFCSCCCRWACWAFSCRSISSCSTCSGK